MLSGGGVKYPRIIIDLKKIEANARVAVEAGAKRGVKIVGVTKACLGAPEVGQAMIAGGAGGLADSRLANLERLRVAGSAVPLTLLRLPMLSEAEDVARLADISLNSSPTVIDRLGRAAVALGRRHGVILMVDTGDQREGVALGGVAELARAAAAADGIDLLGVGTNAACLTACAPSPINLGILAAAADVAAEAADRPLAIVSGGNSSAWGLLVADKLPAVVNELRLGEAILLGRETTVSAPIESMAQDAILIEAEIIESLPERAGHHIAAVGLQDVAVDDLALSDPAWQIVKGSSDHLVLRRSGVAVPVGATAIFRPGYASLMRAMTSPFVVKEYV